MVKEEKMAKLETPEVLEMVRDMGPLPQTEALEYAKNLSTDQQDGKNGCYKVYCMYCPGSKKGCCVACVYNLSCGGCYWPGIGTIPFGCCVILNNSLHRHYYMNAKGDTILVKVDAENETLACYVNNASKGPCCYCIKQ